MAARWVEDDSACDEPCHGSNLMAPLFVVMMTTVSTMAAVFTTPLLVKLLVGSMVPVDAAALISSTIQV